MFSKLKTNEHKEGSQVLEDAEKMGCRSAGVLFWTSVFHVNNPFFCCQSSWAIEIQADAAQRRCSMDLSPHRASVFSSFPFLVSCHSSVHFSRLTCIFLSLKPVKANQPFVRALGKSSLRFESKALKPACVTASASRIYCTCSCVASVRAVFIWKRNFPASCCHFAFCFCNRLL